MESRFIYTTAIKKIRAMTARKKVIEGGTSAGKTYGILPVLIDDATREERLKITVVAETLPAVKEGAVDIFKEVMYNTGRWIQNGWNASTLTYTFVNGSRIQFKSYDSVGKAKSSGKRDKLFLNEANHIPYEIADALMIRSKETYIDYNPDDEFWAHTEVLREPNSEFLRLTFEDNEALPQETYEDLMIKKAKAFKNPNLKRPKLFEETNIKDAYWFNWCKVYLYGELGKLEGVIFSNWDYGPFNEDLLSRNGLDFGYVNDPDAGVQVAIDEKNKKIYLRELLYRKGITIEDLVKKVKLFPPGETVADSAEQRLIEYLTRNSRRSIRAVKKGQGSVLAGIRLIQNYELVVDPESLNLIKELRRYKWSDKGKQQPIDAFNHLIDAIRYVVFTYSSRQFIKQERYEDENTRIAEGLGVGSANTAW